MKSSRKTFLSAALLAGFAVLSAPSLLANSIPSGWTCAGSCGSMGANGVVSLSPIGNTSYQYVTTSGGSMGVGALPTGHLGGETNGSTLATSDFTATVGTSLNFDFDFVTSDGSGYADYAWAELFTAAGQPVALLFTARTEPTGSIAPGVGMPTPTASLNPTSVPIKSGTTWSALGDYSGMCWSAGCGNTGWINSTYTINTAGSYYLEVGVTNLTDESYDTALALDGVTVGGVAITPPTPAVPEPSSLALFGTGIASLAGLIRRKMSR